MTQVQDLPRPTRMFIVLVALLQGLLLYLAETGHDHGWWPFDRLGGRVCWYTLVLSVPALMTLSVRRLDEVRFWQQAAGVAIAFALLATWAAWSATGAAGLESRYVLAPFGFTLAMALFVALPWLQSRLQHRRWHAAYPELFEYAWQNALTLALAALFVGISWLVLHLWAALFALIGIDFFRELFREDAFAYLATGAMAGLGILIGRTQQRPVQVARQILFAIFKGLLPLLAAITLLFVASLPFTGLQPLWDTDSAAAILMSVVIGMVLFVNAVFQDGAGPRPYPSWLRRIVEAGLAVLPVYALLALYALWLRIDQYGWTAERLWVVLLALLLTGYSAGYAVSALRQRGGWLQPLARVNMVLSLVAIAVAVAANSPLLDPHRLAVESQLERLREGQVPPDEFDIEHLRFETGRRGHAAAQALRREPLFNADPARLARLERLLAREHRYRWQSPEQLQRSAVKSVEAARELIALTPGAARPGDAWLQALVAAQLDAGHCLQPGSDCVLLTPDLDGNGTRERLLCDLGQQWSAPCELHALVDGRWTQAGSIHWSDGGDALRHSLRRGELQLRPQRWPDLETGDIRGSVQAEPE